MATEYSAEVAIGSWNRIRIKCDYSGTSATLTIQFRRTSGRSDTWYSDVATLTFNGQAKGANYSYSGYVGTDWIDLRTVSGYTISASGGTYSWRFVDNAVLGCSGTITLPASGTAPSGGYINGADTYWDNMSKEIFVSADKAGVTSTLALTTLELYVTDVPYVTGVARRKKSFSNNSNVKVSNSTSDNTDNTIDIAPNKLVYLGIRAVNSAGEYKYQGGSIVTKPAPFQVAVTNISNTSATINYATTNDGGYYAKTFEYSLDGGENWSTIEVVTGSTIVEHTFALTGLSPGTYYILKTRVATLAGETKCEDIVFITPDVDSEFYCSVSSLATGVTGFYGSVNNQAVKIYKMYCSRNGRAVPFWIKHV